MSLIETIQKVNVDCDQAFSNEQFDLGLQLLGKRQVQLEQLVAHLDTLPKEDNERQEIISLLSQMHQQDIAKVKHFNELKDQSLSQNLKQKNIKKAVGRYTKIKML